MSSCSACPLAHEVDSARRPLVSNAITWDPL